MTLVWWMIVNVGLDPVNYGNVGIWPLNCNSQSDKSPKKRKGTKVTTILAIERGKKLCGKSSNMVLFIGFQGYVPNLNELDSNLICETVNCEG